MLIWAPKGAPAEQFGDAEKKSGMAVVLTWLSRAVGPSPACCSCIWL